MKIKRIKFTPEQLTQILQGKLNISSQLPDDTELIVIKCDLTSNQVTAVISSKTFEDAKETKPIPEFELTFTTKAKTSPLPTTASKPVITSANNLKPEPTLIKKTQPQPTRYASKMEEEFSPEQRKLLNFKIEGNCVIVKPTQFLKAEWEDINDIVKSLGGSWVKGDIISYWTIPLQ